MVCTTNEVLIQFFLQSACLLNLLVWAWGVDRLVNYWVWVRTRS